jgi:hypothetical protein
VRSCQAPRIFITDVIVGARSPTAGKADRGRKARGRIGGQRDAGKTAGANANGDHAAGGNIGPVPYRINRGAQIARRRLRRNEVVATIARPGILGIVSAGRPHQHRFKAARAVGMRKSSR